MSIFRPETLECPACQTENPLDVLYSISADQRPDLRQAVLDDSLQVVACAGCKEPVRLEPRLTYLDVGRSQWIVVWPEADRARWTERVHTAQKMFDRAYGPRAGRVAQEIGAGLVGRVVFGWEALREKLLIRSLGLDDVDVELAKLSLLWAGPVRLGPLRLRARAGDRLYFSGGIEVPLGLVTEIALRPAPWGSLREALTETLYVDVVRLMSASEPLP